MKKLVSFLLEVPLAVKIKGKLYYCHATNKWYTNPTITCKKCELVKDFKDESKN